jgi:hypothetical protein
MARTKTLTNKQRKAGVEAAQKKYREKTKLTRVLIPQFHIKKDENKKFAAPAFKKCESKKAAMVLGLRLVAKLSMNQIEKILK